MSMSDNELSISDILTDKTKNLCETYDGYRAVDDDETDPIILQDSEYYTETDFSNFMESTNFNNHFKIISLNIANLFAKLNSLKLFLSNLTSIGHKPDILVIVETHITDCDDRLSLQELGNIVPGYLFYHKGRRTRRGGGVGILIANDLEYEPNICKTTEKVGYAEECFENIVVRIPKCITKNNSQSKKDLVVAAIYRQPNSANIEKFLEYTESLMKTIDKPSNELVIAGDMNLDLLKYGSHLPTSRYLDIMSNHGVLPRITRPTRIKNQSATLIDHIFTQNNPSTIISGILDIELAGSSGYTDHKPVFTILQANVCKNKFNRLINISYFTRQGTQKRREGLLNHNWDTILLESDPNIIYDQIISVYSNYYHGNITNKTINSNSRRHKREPWITDEILKDIKRRDRLARLKHRRSDYKQLRNEIVSKIRKAHKTYLKQQVKDSIGDIKKHWKIINTTLNKTNNKEEITTDFFHQGRQIQDKSVNTNNFNQYYFNAGKETNESVGTAKLNPKHYLSKFKKRNEHSIIFSEVTSEDVMDVCKNIAPKTSCDSSGFKQNVLLADSGLLAHVLTHMVNCSLRTGICPENSKLARVIPVYKLKGSKHLYENYRPISLLSVFSKIMERLIYNKLFDFLVRYEILFKSQFGFRKGHNTTHATLDFVKTIEDALSNGEFAIGIFCDLSKAFDTLNHDLLLEKLDHYGIRGTAKDWIQSYLNGREQYVDFCGSTSDKLPLLTGVPQGSILGPLLFLLYINDLPAASNLKSVMFADDTNLLIKGKDLQNLANKLNHELESINDYFKANKLKLNTKKTKIVCFRKKTQKVDLTKIKIYLDSNRLEFEEQAVFLGITLDSHLSWDEHCKKVANTISRNNGAINRVKKYLPPPSLKILYNSLVLPHLQYGLSAWGGCTGQNKKRIITIQKRAIRTVSKSYFNSHTEPRLKSLGLLRLDELYKHQSATLIHDIINGRAPEPIKNLVTLNRESTHINLRSHDSDPNHIRNLASRTLVSTNSFSCKGPVIWNDVPREIQDVRAKHIFKYRLKRHLMNTYSDRIVCNNPRCTDRRHHHEQ